MDQSKLIWLSCKGFFIASICSRELALLRANLPQLGPNLGSSKIRILCHGGLHPLATSLSFLRTWHVLPAVTLYDDRTKTHAHDETAKLSTLSAQ
jgi:hypothetical protein